jgi:hypothetical protein
MSIFGRLFGRRQRATLPRPAPVQQPAAAAGEPRLKFGAVGDRFVRIPVLDFFGPYCRSPDGAWLVTWRDGNDAGTHGGHRDSGPGRFYLFHGDALAAQGRAERPNDARVANDGTFVINDWRFGSELSGIFHAYRADGTPIVTRDFAANLVNNGLADDGRFAVCQAANAPHSSDSSILAIFDLRTGQEIAAWVPDSGWADDYSFPAGDATIRLHYRDGAAFDYTLNGRFLDRDRWIVHQAHSGNIYVLDELLRECGEAIPVDLAVTILQGLQPALAAPGIDERQHALACKVRGRCLEAQGDLTGALASFDEAIALDPKIGLKRRVAQLRRALT